MIRQPEHRDVLPDGLSGTHRLLLQINLHVAVGFGLLWPVFGLLTGRWGTLEGFALLAAPTAAALISIGVGAAAWRHGWRRLAVLALALFAMPTAVLGLWILGLMLMSVPLLTSSVGWKHLVVTIRANMAGWLTLVCFAAGLVLLGLSLRRRGLTTASNGCRVLAAALLALMVLVPFMLAFGQFAEALR